MEAKEERRELNTQVQWEALGCREVMWFPAQVFTVGKESSSGEIDPEPGMMHMEDEAFIIKGLWRYLALFLLGQKETKAVIAS